MWRSGVRSGVAGAASFVWRRLKSSRRAAAKLGQAYEPEVLVEVREWIASVLRRFTLCLAHARRAPGIS